MDLGSRRKVRWHDVWWSRGGGMSFEDSLPLKLFCNGGDYQEGEGCGQGRHLGASTSVLRMSPKVRCAVF